MWNLNDDNELDHLSRQAAEEFPLDHSADSWSKVNARLDAEMPEEKRRRYLLFLLFFMVVGSGVFWITRMNGNGDDHSVAKRSTIAKNNVAASTSFEKRTIATTKQNQPAPEKNITVPSNASEANTRKPDEVSSINEANSTDNKNNVTSNISASTKKISAVNKPSQRRKNPGSIAADEKMATGSTTLTGKKSKEKAKQPIGESLPEEPVTTSEATPSSAENAGPPKNEQAAASQENTKSNKKTNDEVSEAQKKSEPKEKELPSRDNIRWTFGAVYAPDISTVNFTHTQPAGMNIGVTIDYKLSERFSLQTAFIYTKKNYKLNGDDYHPPKGAWFDYVDMKDVTGNCTMYDIPLNVRYNAVRKKSSNIFFTAGLSSYLMKKEQYSYYYYYNGAPSTRDREYATNDDYLFSIINFSAGFEKKLNRSFSLQVEPFFKQTLTGVGFGEISLNSTGIYFSLRYNPLKANKTAPVKKN